MHLDKLNVTKDRAIHSIECELCLTQYELYTIERIVIILNESMINHIFHIIDCNFRFFFCCLFEMTISLGIFVLV